MGDDSTYNRFFNEKTTANHIILAYSLFKSIVNKKQELVTKNKQGQLSEYEKEQLDFLRKRGSIFLLISAIANCMEIVLDRNIANHFSLTFKNKMTPEKYVQLWKNIVDIACSFSNCLADGLSDGFRNAKSVDDAIKTFKSLFNAIKTANAKIFFDFKDKTSFTA